MTFKARWEKTHTQHNLTDDLIKQMIKVMYPDDPLKSFAVIDGGCANINIKVCLKTAGQLILRVYVRDPKAAYKEQSLARILENKVPVPEVYRIAEIPPYTTAMVAFVQGTSLRSKLLDNDDCDIEYIMFKVGKCLGTIADTKFDKSGFFDQHLNISQEITQKDFIAFGFDVLDDNNVTCVLSEQERTGIRNVIASHGHLLPDGTEKNLVHGDFDPANILVDEVNGELKIAAVLDWEFSYAGSTLGDVATMLRCAHYMPLCYRDSFLKGLSAGGYVLPSGWQVTLHVLNMLALLDCIKRSDPLKTPNKISDIKELIRGILSMLKKV